MAAPRFKDRIDAGKRLGKLLERYRSPEVIVYGLTRGGVVVAREVAHILECPIECVVVKKISHYNYPEVAVGALAEDGTYVGNREEVLSVDHEWEKDETDRVRQDIAEHVKLYRGSRERLRAEGKIAILVDDGVATGYTLSAAARMLRKDHPRKLVIAVPVTPAGVRDMLAKEADVIETIVSDPYFLGAVGAYYGSFEDVSEEEVLRGLLLEA